MADVTEKTSSASSDPSEAHITSTGSADATDSNGESAKAIESSGSPEQDAEADTAEEADDKEDGELESTPTAETDAPPLPDEAPPLPAEAAPGTTATEEDDGWAPVWEASAQAFYFYNRFTGASQWTNPRVPDASTTPAAPGTERAPGTEPAPLQASITEPSVPLPPSGEAPIAGGYNPALHGDYDPNAWYAQSATQQAETAAPTASATDPNGQYAASAAFNRFTGRFQNAEINPENFNDENKSKRQMNAFFDVDAAANSHEGRSLKAERSGKKLSKTELKQFKEKRKAKKEEKRRAWLRD